MRVDLLLVTFPVTAENRLLRLLRKLWVLPVEIRLSAHTQKLRYQPRTYSRIGDVSFIDLFDKPIAGWDALVKSIADKVIASRAAFLLAPVMAAVWTAVKLDSRGPALFRQKRYGFNNELIEVYKFRSMFVDQTDHTAKRMAVRGDPRVTRVGRFIRKTSLDELPQLFNVLKGELSLVGPRPHATNANAERRRIFDEIVEEYFARHRVKPGITGWAQVNGWRGNTDTVEKIHRRARARPLLHRELVAGFRPLHPRANALFPALDGECLLRAAATATAAGCGRFSLRQLQHAALWLFVASGWLVVVEPSPYECCSLSRCLPFCRLRFPPIPLCCRPSPFSCSITLAAR